MSNINGQGLFSRATTPPSTPMDIGYNSNGYQLEVKLLSNQNCKNIKYTEYKIYQHQPISKDWVLVYNQSYSHPTTHEELQSIQCRTNQKILIGAQYIRNDTTTLYLAAVGPSDLLQNLNTELNQPKQLGDVYWYLTPKKSFGFSPIQQINQIDIDVMQDVNTMDQRLSWHLHGQYGGWRAGKYIDLYGSTLWYKLIYCI